MKKICFVLGTRPEIIKLSSLIRFCEKNNINYFVVHSNQHYSDNMDKVFFDDLNLSQPEYNLNVGSATHGNQIGKILINVEEILMDEKPDVVIVQGDTNTVAAAALAASKMNIHLAHVEAGLRSYDKTMPEETNRIITDHLSDSLFCPTKIQEAILLNEGIPKEKIFIVGNSVVDALLENIKIAEKKTDILSELDINKKEYVLVTAHRAGNVDKKFRLTQLLDCLRKVGEIVDCKFVYPLHPRTKKKIEEFGLKLPEKIIVTEPLSYLKFIQLENNAKLILTDSGGLQEEACVLHVPCITLRENTERPLTVEIGANIIVGLDQEKLINAVKKQLTIKLNWENPYGTGKTGEKIINTLLNFEKS